MYPCGFMKEGLTKLFRLGGGGGWTIGALGLVYFAEVVLIEALGLRFWYGVGNPPCW